MDDHLAGIIAYCAMLFLVLGIVALPVGCQIHQDNLAFEAMKLGVSSKTIACAYNDGVGTAKECVK